MTLVFRTVLVTIVLTAVQIVPAQTAEKPKAFVFDEFGRIGKKETRNRTFKFRKEIARREGGDESARYFFFFYRGESEESTDGVERLVRDALWEDCRDCMGIGGPRILFVQAGTKKERLVQFWIAPQGAEEPKPE
jgi:hypothetical protein